MRVFMSRRRMRRLHYRFMVRFFLIMGLLSAVRLLLLLVSRLLRGA